MRKLLVILTIICTLFLVQCNKQQGTETINITGRWYVENITDKSTGQVFANSLPADTIIIFFQNDTLYGGHTHINQYVGKYTFDGQSTLVVYYPMQSVVAEDQLGSAFLNLLRGCFAGYNTCTGGPTASKIVVQGNVMFIDNQGKYKAQFRKI